MIIAGSIETRNLITTRVLLLTQNAISSASVVQKDEEGKVIKTSVSYPVTLGSDGMHYFDLVAYGSLEVSADGSTKVFDMIGREFTNLRPYLKVIKTLNFLTVTIPYIDKNKLYISFKNIAEDDLFIDRKTIFWSVSSPYIFNGVIAMDVIIDKRVEFRQAVEDYFNWPTLKSLPSFIAIIDCKQVFTNEKLQNIQGKNTYTVYGELIVK